MRTVVIGFDYNSDLVLREKGGYSARAGCFQRTTRKENLGCINNAIINRNIDFLSYQENKNYTCLFGIVKAIND